MDLDFIKKLAKPADTKIVLLVLDGLGGAPLEKGGATELETAHTPNLDEIAAQSLCGLHQPVATGITPGSGPAHLGLFGYDPIKYQVGRGVLAALGIDFDLRGNDVAQLPAAARSVAWPLRYGHSAGDRLPKRIRAKHQRPAPDLGAGAEPDGVHGAEASIEQDLGHRPGY